MELPTPPTAPITPPNPLLDTSLNNTTHSPPNTLPNTSLDTSFNNTSSLPRADEFYKSIVDETLPRLYNLSLFTHIIALDTLLKTLELRGCKVEYSARLLQEEEVVWKERVLKDNICLEVLYPDRRLSILSQLHSYTCDLINVTESNREFQGTQNSRLFN